MILPILNRRVARVLRILGFPLVALTVFLWWADLLRTKFFTFIHFGTSVIMPACLLMVMVLTALFATDFIGPRPREPRGISRYGNAWTQQREAYGLYEASVMVWERRKTFLVLLSRASAVMCGLLLIGVGVLTWSDDRWPEKPYLTEMSAPQTKASLPTFAYRLPRATAVVKLRAGMDSLFPGEPENVTYVTGARRAPAWTALVYRTDSSYKGSYAAIIEQPAAGGEPITCSFSAGKATRRLGGYFNHSLERLVAHHASGVTVEASDAYGYCGGGGGFRPKVVMPLKKVEGYFPAQWVPGGVAVYDGWTGRLTVFDEVTGGIPGPLYPASLAKTARRAVQKLGVAGDGEARFQLVQGPGPRADIILETAQGSVYVTPLAAAGSKRVTAVAVIPADTVKAGVRNTFTVYRLPEARVGPPAMVDHLLSWFADLTSPESGAPHVLEVVPHTSTDWYASVGAGGAVWWRARVDEDGATCVESLSGVEMRCASAAGGDSSETGAKDPLSELELSSLTDAELARLQRSVEGEVEARTTP